MTGMKDVSSWEAHATAPFREKSLPEGPGNCQPLCVSLFEYLSTANTVLGLVLHYIVDQIVRLLFSLQFLHHPMPQNSPVGNWSSWTPYKSITRQVPSPSTTYVCHALFNRQTRRCDGLDVHIYSQSQSHLSQMMTWSSLHTDSSHIEWWVSMQHPQKEIRSKKAQLQA